MLVSSKAYLEPLQGSKFFYLKHCRIQFIWVAFCFRYVTLLIRVMCTYSTYVCHWKQLRIC